MTQLLSLLRELKSLRVLVIHPLDAEVRVVLDQLQRIGCIVE